MSVRDRKVTIGIMLLIILLFYLMYKEDNKENKIHFLPVNGDAILLESNGRYALIDGGEEKKSDENEFDLIKYIKEVCSNKNGNVSLEFIIGTHSHSDHIGGLAKVIDDPQINVKKAYIKRYDPNKIEDYELDNWNNQEVYTDTMEALVKENTKIIQDISVEPFYIGEFKVEILNAEYDSTAIKKGENENSLGVKVTKGNKIVFLAGDINNKDGDEDRLAPIIGKVTLLKLGHHGVSGSSTEYFLENIQPKYAIVTGPEKGIHDSVRDNIEHINTKLYSTISNNVIIVDLEKENLDIEKYKRVSARWELVDNKWKYIDFDERYLYGWQYLIKNDIGDTYYFDENGDMQTGWAKINGKWYYFKDNGGVDLNKK